MDSLRAHLSRGGNLFLTGQNIAEHLSARGSTFLSEVLHVSWDSNILDVVLHGVQDDPVGAGLNLIGLAGGDGARNQLSTDVLIPDEQANVSIVYDTTAGTVAGVRIDQAIPGNSGSRVVFFGFGIEGINGLVPALSTRDEVLGNVLNWLNDIATSVESRLESSNIIEQFALLPNYPNPFNSETVIRYKIPSHVTTTQVKLRIFNILGREVGTLVDEESVKPGEYRVRWHGLDDSGVPVATGVYLYKMEANNFQEVRKLLFIK